MSDCRIAENLLRLMASAGLSVHSAAGQTGLDERTIRGILGGKKPHAQTLHRLAVGLGVKADEFFVDPARLLYRRFDCQTNPAVAEAVELHSELFAGWTEEDYDELHSRVGAGGPLSFEGVLAAANQMNRNRRVHEQLDVLLESSLAELTTGIMDLLYQQTFPRQDD